MKNSGVIHISSIFIRGSSSRGTGGLQEGEGGRVKLVKLFIGERWPIHVALARMRGMSSSMESKPRLLNIAMSSLSRRYIDFQTDRRVTHAATGISCPVIYFAIITTTPRVPVSMVILNVPRPWVISYFFFFSISLRYRAVFLSSL